MNLEVDRNGDIVGPIDPREFGWTSSRAAAGVGEDARTLEEIAALPGVEVSIGPYEGPTPGPKVPRAKWGEWLDGHAPPVAMMSQDGNEHESGSAVGTLAYFDRITDALGTIAKRLLARPERSPMVIYDFVGKRRIAVSFDPPPQVEGIGSVYVITDGLAYKVGYTYGEPAKRMRGLQTGNPRPLQCALIVRHVSIGVEVLLHRHFDRLGLHLTGEWYEKDPIDAAASEAGGLGTYIRSILGPDVGSIEVL